MKTFLKTGLLIVAMSVVMPAQAANVLFGYDDFLGPDSVSPVLASGGHSVTTHANDWAAFDTDLATGSFDLVIALVQNSGSGKPDQATLAAYIAGGGKVIWTDWTRTASYATLFNASYTGNSNDSSFTFIPPISIPNPVTVTNPGWGIFTMALAPTAGGTSLCTASPSGDSCMVQGNGGRTIILGFLADVFGEAEAQAVMRAAIGAAAPVTEGVPVPTMSQWALIAMALLLLMFGIARHRRLNS